MHKHISFALMQKSRIFLLFVFVCLPALNLAQAVEDYSLWRHWTFIDINTAPAGAGVTSDIADFPLIVRLSASNFDFSQSNPNGSDIRFSARNGAPLAYQIERWDGGGQNAEIWVRVPVIYGNSAAQFILMHWGNAGAADSSRGSGVFQSSNGYASVWHMNDNAASSLVADAAGGHHGTHSSNTDTRSVAGLLGGALSYDGTATYTSISDHADFREEGPVTMSAWVYNRDGDGGEYRGLYVKGRDNPSKDYHMGFWRDVAPGVPGKWLFTAAYGSDWDDDATVNGWAHLALTYVNGGAWEIYLNGVDVGGGGLEAGLPRNGAENIYLGRSFNSGEYFDGYIDEVRWSTTVRSPDWIKLSYETQKAGQQTVSVVFPAASSGNFSGWTGHRAISLNTSPSGADVAGDVSGFPVLVRLNALNFNFGEASSSGSDIRFSRGGAPLFHEVDYWDRDNALAHIWVRVDLILGNNRDQTIDMHWGNPGAPDRSAAGHVFRTTEGFTGVWHLGEDPAAGAGSIRDATANGYHGTPYGVWTAGDRLSGNIGRALDFDGTADADGIELPDIDYGPGNIITVGAWFRTVASGQPGASGEGLIVAKNQTHSASPYDLFVDNGQFSSAVPGSENPAPARVNDGAWHYGVMTLNGNEISLFLDGRLAVHKTNAVPADNQDPLGIGGAVQDKSYRPFLGQIDEVRVSHAARSADWIKLAYENQRPAGTLIDMENYGNGWSLQGVVNLITHVAGANVWEDVFDFPVLLRLNSSNFDFTANKPGGEDIRFAKADGTPLFYEIERWDNAGRQAEIWVKVDTVKGNSQQALRMYWGNSAAPGLSRGDRVFSMDNGFDAVWHLKENLKDASDNYLDMMDKGSLDAEGIAGTGREFSGLNSYTETFVDFAPQRQGTISFWVSADSFYNDTRILGNHDAFESKFNSDSTVSGDIFAAGSDNLKSGFKFISRQWHYLSFSWNYNSNDIWFYLDGGLKDNGKQANDLPAPNPFRLGTRYGAAQFLDGKLDEVRIANQIRSEAWIKLCYENMRPSQKFVLLNESNTLPELGYSGGGVIPRTAVTQAVDGSGIVTIRFKAIDGDGDDFNLEDIGISLSGGGFYGLTGESGALTPGWRKSYAAGTAWENAPVHSIELMTKHSDVGLAGLMTAYTVVRLGGNDGSGGGITAVTDAFSVDNRPPLVTIDSVTSAGQRPQVRAKADEPLSRLVITLQGADYAAAPISGDSLSWAVAEGTVAALGEGRYDVSFTAADRFGNEKTGTASGVLSVNPGVPVVTVDPLVTSLLSPGISGTVSDTAAVCSVTVAQVTAAADVFGDGTWLVPPGVFGPLAPGVYNVRAAAANASGTGEDETADELEIISARLSVFVRDLVTNSRQPDLSGTVSDASAAVTARIAGQTVSASVNGAGVWTVAGTALPELDEGIYPVIAEAQNAGTAGASDTGTVRVDLTPPGLASLLPRMDTKTGLQPQISITFTEAVRAGGGKLGLYKTGSAVPVLEADSGSSSLTGWNTASIRIRLEGDLQPSSVYYVLVDGGIFRDSAGNYFSGISGETDWRFETRSPDDAYIDSLAGISPPGLYGLGDTVRFALFFSEPVTLSGGRLLVPLVRGKQDTSLAVNSLSSDSVIRLVYAVQPGDSAMPLKIGGSLLLEQGATLRNTAGNDVILSVDAGSNLQDHVVYYLDGIPPRVSEVSLSSGETVLFPRVAYTLDSRTDSGRIAWSDGMLNGVLLDSLGRADTILTLISLDSGKHAVALPPGSLTAGARYTVSLWFFDEAGNMTLLERTAVKLSGGISSLSIYPRDTSATLGGSIRFSATGLDMSGGGFDLVALDSVVWKAWGNGNISQDGLFLASRLGTGHVSAVYGGFADTVTVQCTGGTILFEAAGNDTVFLGSNVQIIIPRQQPPLESSVMQAALLDVSGASTDFEQAGPAISFSNEAGNSMIFSNPVFLKLRIDDAYSAAGLLDRVQVYWINPARGGAWEWIDAERQGQWLVIRADTLRSYFVGLDISPPLLGWLARPEEGDVGVQLRVSLSAFDNIANPRISLVLGTGGGGDTTLFLPYTPHVPAQGEIPGSWLSESGLFYVVSITDGGSTITLDTVDVRIRLHGILSLPDSLAVPRGMYTMVSFPLEPEEHYVDSLVYDDWGPADSTKWRLFGYREGFREMKGRSQVTPGLAYWFRHSRVDSQSVTMDGEGVWTLPVSRPHGIKLSAGWNCVSNPFMFSVDTSQFSFRRGKRIQYLYAYKSGLWKTREDHTVFDPWQGYAVWNGTDADPISDSLFVYPFSASAPLPKISAEPAGTRIRMTAASGSSLDGELVMAFGVPGSGTGKDNHDYPKPPMAGGRLSAWLSVPWDTAGAWLADARGGLGEGQTWAFQVRNAGDEKTLLRFQWPEALPDTMAALLFDLDGGRTVEMPASSVPLSKGVPGTQRFELAVGTQDYIRGQAERFRGKFSIFSLSQNYPNPFSGTTHIQYSVPAGFPARVSLAVYGLDGRMLLSLENGRTQSPGQHLLMWDGSDGRGRQFPAGTYFLRLSTEAGDKAVRTMVILR